MGKTLKLNSYNQLLDLIKFNECDKQKQVFDQLI